jgi:predicted SnoaL-like aldol condensation-catalyzing enzyme
MSSSQTERNKALVLRALDELFNKHDLTALDRYWSPHYIQHNPDFADGPAGLRDVVSGKSDLTWEQNLVVAEGDLVAVHSRYFSVAFGPVPIVGMDFFVVRDGKLVEHWDVLQPERDSRSGHPMFGKPKS